MNIEPKLEALDCSRNDNPEIVTVWATPGVSRVISIDQLPWPPGCAAATPSRATGRSRSAGPGLAGE